MEIVFDPRLTHYSVSIVYTAKEWGNLESRYRDSGYERYVTQTLFGRNITAEVYRYKPNRRVVMLYNVVVSELQRTGKSSDYIAFVDDINRPPFDVSSRGAALFNLAVFRVVPMQSGDKMIVLFDVPPSFIDVVSDEVFTTALAVIGRLANPEFKRIRVLIE